MPFGYRFNRETGFLEIDATEAELVPVIFDLYAKQKMGVQAVAKWLNQNGHRTHAGRRWSSLSVLSVLRNEVYRGQIFFRSGYHPAPHTAIVDARLFESVQEILKARDESMAKRRTNLTTTR